MPEVGSARRCLTVCDDTIEPGPLSLVDVGHSGPRRDGGCEHLVSVPVQASKRRFGVACAQGCTRHALDHIGNRSAVPATADGQGRPCVAESRWVHMRRCTGDPLPHRWPSLHIGLVGRRQGAVVIEGRRRALLIAFAGATFLIGVVGFWLKLGEESFLDRIADAAYYAGVLFVGSFPDLGEDPGALLRMVRLLAIGITFGTAIYLVAGVLRRYAEAQGSRKNTKHWVVIGSGALALEVARKLAEGRHPVSMVVPAAPDPALRLRRVKQVFTYPEAAMLAKEVAEVVEGANGVVAVVENDELSLHVLDSLKNVHLQPGATVHLAFESSDVAAAFAGARFGQEVNGRRTDCFRLIDRFVTSDVVAASDFEADPSRPEDAGEGRRFRHLVVVGGGPMAESIVIHAANGFGVVDGVEITCVGSSTEAVARAARRSATFARVEHHRVNGDLNAVARATVGILEDLPPNEGVRVCICDAADSKAIAQAAAIRRIDPTGTKLSVVVEGRALPAPTLEADGLEVLSLVDSLSEWHHLTKNPIAMVRDWSRSAGFKWVANEQVEQAVDLIDEIGLSVVPGASPAPLMGKELLAVVSSIAAVPGADTGSFGAYAWASRLPIWLARSGYGLSRRTRQTPVFGMDEVEKLAAFVHASYWSNLAPERHENKKALGMAPSWAHLKERWRVSNRDQVWFYPAFLAHAGYDIVAGSGSAFPHTKNINGDELDFLARQEHIRWMSERAASGWIPADGGAEQDAEARTHPLITPWAKLTDEQRAMDVDAIVGISDCLQTVNLVIRPLTIGAVTEQLSALDAPTYISTRKVSAERLRGQRTWTARSGAEMTASAGDWYLKDLASDDVWSITDERFASTYTPVADGIYRKEKPVRAVRVAADIEVVGPEGTGLARDGDWVLSDGLFPAFMWPLSDDDFMSFYRRVER